MSPDLTVTAKLLGIDSTKNDSSFVFYQFINVGFEIPALHLKNDIF